MAEIKGSTVTSIEEQEKLYDLIRRAYSEFDEKGETGKGFPFVTIGSHIFQLNGLVQSLKFAFEGKRDLSSGPLSPQAPIDSFIEISNKHLNKVDEEYNISNEPFAQDERPIKVMEPNLSDSILEACKTTIEQAKGDKSSHYIFSSNWGEFDIDKIMRLNPEELEGYLESYRNAIFDTLIECEEPLQNHLLDELIAKLANDSEVIDLLKSGENQIDITHTRLEKNIDNYKRNGGNRIKLLYMGGRFNEKKIMPYETMVQLKEEIEKRKEIAYTASQIGEGINPRQGEIDKVIEETAREATIPELSPETKKLGDEDSTPGGDKR